MNLWSIFLSVLAIVIFIFVIVYSIKNKGKENLFFLGICFFIPTILFTITLLFASFPQDRIVFALKTIMAGSAILSFLFSISYFRQYYKKKIN